MLPLGQPRLPGLVRLWVSLSFAPCFSWAAKRPGPKQENGFNRLSEVEGKPLKRLEVNDESGRVTQLKLGVNEKTDRQRRATDVTS